MMVGGEVYGDDVEHEVSLLIKIFMVSYLSGVQPAGVRGSGNGWRWLAQMR
jgi:hypothetical protein